MVRASRVALALVALGLAGSAGAQPATGVVHGVALAGDGDVPVPFALVRLLADDTLAVAPRQGITGADGRFRFAAVAPGDYRLQLLRIGFRPVLSPPLAVRAGEATEHALVAGDAPVALPAVTVDGGRCVAGDALADAPYLAAVWAQARTGVEVRRAFDLRYRYVRLWHQRYDLAVRMRPDGREARTDTLVSEPDSVLPRLERIRAERRATGYGEGPRLRVPFEAELFHDGFLREHCLEAAVADEDGLVGVRFRPLRPRAEGYGVRGTIWLDPESYLIERLDVQHLHGERPISDIRFTYEGVPVDGRPLRLPVQGSGWFRPAGMPGVTNVAIGLTFEYRDVEEVAGR